MDLSSFITVQIKVCKYYLRYRLYQLFKPGNNDLSLWH